MSGWGPDLEGVTWRFDLFGIPVRVHVAFWICALLLGLNSNTLTELVAWVFAMFVAILVHELGHALMAQRYGFRPEILLYGLGGLTDYSGGAGGLKPLGSWDRIYLALAGPLAGIALAIGVAVLAAGLGAQIQIARIFGVIPVPLIATPIGSQPLTSFLQSIIWIGWVWGLINLMPVYPLDGGHIAREIMLWLNPQRGLEQSLVLSLYCALFLACLGFFAHGSLFMLLLFGSLAYNSYALLRGMSSYF
ncbi:MAG: site-2 protease family protein [Thermoguttaceae bacterium]|nr:site-2 protease family protein [Thermoguttaceae bacterium]MDW8078477.1 site-2 protease family protein [Thermoguttaceae bacterium]